MVFIWARLYPASTAPIEGAAYKSPNPMGPTCKICWAKIGSRAVAEAKNVPTKSKSMVLQMIVFDFTNARPSNAAWKEALEGVPSISPDVFIKSKAVITDKKEI